MVLLEAVMDGRQIDLTKRLTKKISAIQNTSTPIDFRNLITFIALKLGLLLEDENVVFIQEFS